MTHIIKGCPSEAWDKAQAVQHEPFIYIMSNGSRWAGAEAGDIAELLEMLSKHPLDVERFGPDFWNVNPCEGVINPDWTYEAKVPHYIAGPRLYSCDGVVRFFGNFLTYSHGFNIDTNDAETIAKLQDAITRNVQQQRKAA